jgi:hypothetical protein
MHGWMEGVWWVCTVDMDGYIWIFGRAGTCWEIWIRHERLLKKGMHIPYLIAGVKAETSDIVVRQILYIILHAA